MILKHPLRVTGVLNVVHTHPLTAMQKNKTIIGREEGNSRVFGTIILNLRKLRKRR